MQRIPVGENLGKKITLADGKIEVEITNYYANAKLRGTAQFESQGDEPKNPLLEMQIYLPGQEKPIREIASAKMPGLSLAAVHGGDCPVKFWYHQPACPAPGGIEFLRTPDGKLYCRVGLEGKYVSRGEVKEGSTIDFTETLRFKILKYLPFAIHKVVPQPAEPASDERNLGPAALVEVEFGGVKQPVWLVRDEQKYNFQPIFTPAGNLVVNFGFEDLPLEDFSLKLLKFTQEMNPGNQGVAAFISSVQIIDKDGGIEKREIAMNQPLTHGKYTFYQADCGQLDDGQNVSILSVSYDPGRFLKYFGCLMICLGMVLKYTTHLQYYKKLRRFVFHAESREFSNN